jgi:flavin reductase (DIM6/NTAB) family NADH-FMN oxidoreductase RutF
VAIELLVEVDESRLRAVMARYVTGVAVVTALSSEGPIGATVNSFTSVTLDPPTVLVCLHTGGRACAAVLTAGTYAINILSGSQGHLAHRFATPGLSEAERFRWLDVNYAITGSPLIVGASAWLDCRLRESFVVGTHRILLGDVLAAGTDPLGEAPLLYYQRAMRALP